MDWTFEDFPVELNQLNVKVKNKAIEIANDLVKQGYSKEEAIKTAIKQAEEWYYNSEG